jgi:6-phosphogluconolactonase/glucosamine-6-phosphate isomerase/deaminase
MKETIVDSLAEPVGKIWKNLQEQYTSNGFFYIASPLSSTPLPIYQWVVEHAEEFTNWDKVRFVLMDEMLSEDKSPFSYVPTDDAASYEGFAMNHLLVPLKDKISTINEVIKPELESIEEFDTPLDLLILAIGVNGNYANVMPGTTVDTGWHITHLSPEFRQAHTKKGSQSYEGAEFREYGMSLGPQQVFSAKNVVVIISGEKKRRLAEQLMSYSAFDPNFPLSIIFHPNVKDRVQIFMTADVVK